MPQAGRRPACQPAAPEPRPGDRSLSLVGSEDDTLTRHHEILRSDALTVARAAIDAVDAGRLVKAALPSVGDAMAQASRCSVVAAGKASAQMLRAFLTHASRPLVHAMQVAHVTSEGLPPHVEVLTGGHPVPNASSVAAGARALDLARALAEDDVLVVLLSGGASALLSLPAEGLPLADKQAATKRLMAAGADIHTLNCVRKHLSDIKGGRLAAACRGRTLCLAISDVVGDDISVIGSGPAVADPSTYADALGALDRFGGRGAYPVAAVTVLEEGLAGRRPESPKPGSIALARADTRVIGSRAAALAGARAAAERLGYHVVVHGDEVVGEARVAAERHLEVMREVAAAEPRPVCLLSAGETTVTVTGGGRGGRNQEFALALVRALSAFPRPCAVASVGTDGIDGPTDAAGAAVDSNSLARAEAAGSGPPERFLGDNDAYTYFLRSGELIVTGPTDTNVGDVQVVLMGDEQR